MHQQSEDDEDDESAENNDDESAKDNDDESDEDEASDLDTLLQFPEPPTEDEVDLYETSGKHPDPPSLNNFRIEFYSRSMGSAWNFEAARVFTKSFVAAYPQYKKQREKVEKHFITYLRSLRETYIEWQNGGKTPEKLERLAQRRARSRRSTVSSSKITRRYLLIGN